ncbi:MAG: DUF3108 domain-containing protein [Candidatus Omnitrophica bacterium]|nr:DUF3108 domain-containing protein [Candidatus Omnitrophota bacterium]
MKKKLIICAILLLCLLLSSCITSKSTISKEKLKEEVAQTSPGEISLELPEENIEGVKLLKKRKPYNIFSLFRKKEDSIEKEEVMSPAKTPAVKVSPPEKEPVKIQPEEEKSTVIAKKETVVEKPSSIEKKVKPEEKSPAASQYIPSLELWRGECLVYQITWNSISIGKGMLACEDIENSYGDVYHIFGLTVPERSIMGAKLSLYRMDAYLDKKTLQPYYYYQYSKGSDEKEDILEIRFDWKNKKYYTKYRKYDKGRLYSTKEKTLVLPDVAYDSISIFYIVRTLDLDGTSSFTIPIAMKEIWDLNIKTLGRKTVNIPGKGKGDVYVLKPQAKSNEGFFTKGAMDLWLTADNKRLPVYLEGRVTLGKARMSLLSEKRLPQGTVLNAETITNILSEFN